MTRRKLWSLTVLVCLLLTLPGLPALFKGWLEQGRHLAGAAGYAAIARRTRLAQDVVRDLLGSDAETAANDRDFGDLLQASAMLPGA